MLKLRLASSSSPTSTTALTLTQEYDEMQKSNIFPPVQEDNSVASSGASGGGRRLSLDASVRSICDDSHSAAAHSSPGGPVAALKAQVEFLRAQLAERDNTVNELQRQIQQDKRAHDKLQTKWDLFFGGARVPHTAHSKSGKEETTTLSQTELLKLNQHMDQLEADKEACIQKTVRLSVALAESKAKVSTLESQLEECQRIVMIQNCSPSLGFGRVTVKPTPAVTPVTPPGTIKNKAPPPRDCFLPVPMSDIQLHRDHAHHVTISLDDDDEIGSTLPKEEQDSYDDSFSLESESLELSNRTLSLLSERGSSQRGVSHSERGTASTTATAKGYRVAFGLREFTNRLSSRTVLKNPET